MLFCPKTINFEMNVVAFLVFGKLFSISLKYDSDYVFLCNQASFIYTFKLMMFIYSLDGKKIGNWKLFSKNKTHKNVLLFCCKLVVTNIH